MAEDKNSKVTQNQDRINKLIDGLTLFDDGLMSRVFDKNIEATELLLRIILERKIKVISVNGQEEMKSAAVGGRIKDSYVIFIYKRDKFQEGLPLYHIDRYVRETGKLFEDGSHIIYVNGNYKGDDEIGHLMQDFHQTDPDNMHYKELSQGVRHFKEVEEGRDTMCEAVQEYAKEYAKTEKAELVENFMKNMNLTLKQALDAAGIQGEEREAIIQLLQKQE